MNQYEVDKLIIAMNKDGSISYLHSSHIVTIPRLINLIRGESMYNISIDRRNCIEIQGHFAYLSHDAYRRDDYDHCVIDILECILAFMWHRDVKKIIPMEELDRWLDELLPDWSRMDYESTFELFNTMYKEIEWRRYE